MKILLIDDDKDDQVLFAEAVNQINKQFECEVADDGLQGLNYLATTDVLPDIIFLDINMPMLSGRETLQAIRGNLKLQSIPVVIYSTSNNVLDFNWAKALNAGYVVKAGDFPSLRSSLHKELSNVLASAKAQQNICYAD